MITLEEQVESVTIKRIEGPDYLCKNTLTFNTIDEADTKLVEWSIGETNEDSFGVLYSITFLNGKEYNGIFTVGSYNSKIDLKKWFHKQFAI
jgi:hypothetical protein